jgi:hypothetical protein
MHAADPARAHEPDPDAPTDAERPSDGRRAEQPLRHAEAELPRTRFAGVVAGRRETVELCFDETDADDAVDDADRRRDGASGAHALLRLERDLDSLPGGEPVRDEGRLERDDRAPLLERRGDLRRHLDHGIAPSLPTHRAAVASASSGPPTR